jgi:hypothetical protein
VDHTGSEEDKQPAKESGTPSQFSAGDDRATSARSGQDEDSESARRAFELLERFSGELEEILLSLERTRSSAASAENNPQAPERTFSPSSIHFDPSSISARIDPYALPPVESPGAASRSTLRLVSEAVFLILVAAISARTDLRPLLIAVAETAAFLIVASVELAIAHDRHRYRQLPASAPAFASSPAQETETTSKFLSVTLDQVDPLVWRADRRDDDAETNWPLATIEPPSEPDEAESVEEAQEGVTEISTALHSEGGVAATPAPAPEARSEAASESAVEMPAAEPEPEAQPESADEIPISAAESEHHRRFGLFRHEASEPVSESKPDAEIEPLVETEAELENTAEIPASEVKPKRHGHFHLFGREEKALGTEAELKAEAGLESEPEIPAAEPESEHHRRFGLFRHEASEPVSESEPDAEPEPEVEAEAEVEPEVEPEPEAQPESADEIPASEPESERHRRFGLFRHEAREPVSESEPDAKPEPEAEVEPESEHHRRFGLFRHEASEPVSESEPDAEIEPQVEAEAEPEAQPESADEIPAAEPAIKPKHSDRMHRFRRTAAEAPNGEGEPLEDAFWQRSVEEPGSSVGAGDTTIEIDLPPEISIDEIERTLEELGGRKPDLRRRRWLRGASAEKDATEQSANDETASGESEMRLAAELERRRCEREYLRSLRTPR